MINRRQMSSLKWRLRTLRSRNLTQKKIRNKLSIKVMRCSRVKHAGLSAKKEI